MTPLVPHPSTAAAPVRAIGATVRREAAGTLHLTVRLDGYLAGIRVPTPVAPRFIVGLWNHTCFEAFIAADGDTAYCEFNLSPSGEWAAFAFTDYREIGALDPEPSPPRIRVETTADSLTLHASIALGELSSAYVAAPLLLGLSAVIETIDGALSYWSLAHPVGTPDFHHRETRTLRVPAPPR